MTNNTMGTCPLGGLWYTCTAQIPTFLGCCTSNPCNGKGCPAADLRAAGLGYGQGKGQGEEVSLSLGSYWPNVYCSSGSWWICASHNPSFQGCCENNPCSGNATYCPQSELHPAAFKSVNTSLNFTGWSSTTFQTATPPKATSPTVAITGGEATDRPLILGTSGLARTTPWNTTAYSTQASSNDTNLRNKSITASTLHFHTSSIPLPTGAAPPNASSIQLGNNISNGGVMTTPNIVTVTSISTFTAVQISVYTVPYSLSDSTHPSASPYLSTTTNNPTANSIVSLSIPSTLHAASSTSLPPAATTSLPSGTPSDSKLVAWGATGGVAFILVFASLSWWLHRRKNRTKSNSEKTTPTSSSLTWLPWRKRKELPRTSLSAYPFRGMAPFTSTSSEHVSNETWSDSLRDYRNFEGMAAARYGMNDSQSRNFV